MNGKITMPDLVKKVFPQKKAKQIYRSSSRASLASTTSVATTSSNLSVLTASSSLSAEAEMWLDLDASQGWSSEGMITLDELVEMNKALYKS